MEILGPQGEMSLMDLVLLLPDDKTAQGDAAQTRLVPPPQAMCNVR